MRYCVTICNPQKTSKIMNMTPDFKPNFRGEFLTLKLFFSIVLGVLLLQCDLAYSQFRENLPTAGSNMGPITKPYEFNPSVNTSQVSFMQRFSNSFAMNHSYEMTMGSVGGNVFNQNMYTNSMQFMFTDKMTGRLDLGVAHSPFGDSFMGMQQGPQFLIRNAEFNYQVNDKVRFQFNFSQDPMFMNRNAWGSNVGGSPFFRNNSMWGQDGF